MVRRAVFAGLFILFGMSVRAQVVDTPPYIPAIVQFSDVSELAELEAQGAIIWRTRADMALALLPNEDGSRLPGTRSGDNSPRLDNVVIEKGRRAQMSMDKARAYFDAEKIYTGEGLAHPYSGAGVVVGFVDTGFDPNHIAFLDSEGHSRVKLLVAYDEPYGKRTVVDTPEGIAAWTTDNDDEFHSTHVANILAGSYTGLGLQGMAPGAEIVATTSQLYDAGILAACEDIVEYAHNVGKPAVINLSLGNNNGPHDGTTLFCRYLDLLAEEAIVCLSAGNGGYHTISQRLQFSDSTPEWQVKLCSSDWSLFHIYGMTDAWSYDNRPVGVRLLIFDEYAGKIVYQTEDLCNGEPFTFTLNSANDSRFRRYLEGEVLVEGRIDPLNGRWTTEVLYDTKCSEVNPNGNWGRYVLSFAFTGAPGTKVDICSDGASSWFRPMPGHRNPINDLSISDLCTGYNTISVGMYTSRNIYPTLSGEDETFNFEPGIIYKSSGYGTLIDGRSFPLTVAPGATIVSAINSHFVAKHPEKEGGLVYVGEVDGKKYYWGGEIGTSMSSPYTAGVIATWLEADPVLTYGDVKRIIEETNLTDCPDPTNPRNGHGWLQPYAGLKRVISTTGVVPGVVDVAKPVATIFGDKAEVLNPSGNPLTIEVYALDGTRMLTHTASAERIITIDLSSLPHGPYLLRLTPDHHTPSTLKIFV